MNSISAGDFSLNESLEKHRTRDVVVMSIVFGTCMFTTGMVAFATENVLATFSSITLGNSVEQFPKVFGLMMLMMGIAGMMQARVSDKHLITTFIAIELGLATLAGFGPSALYAVFGLAPDHYMAAHYLIVASIGFLIGYEIPIVMRILEISGFNLKNNLKVVYAMDFVGAFVGGNLFYEMLKMYPLTKLAFVLSVANFTLAAIAVFFLISRKMVRRRISVVSVLILVGASQAYGFVNAVDWGKLLEQKFFDDPIVANVQTQYQKMTLTQARRTGDTRLYLNGNTQFASSDEARYHDFLVHPPMTLAKSQQNVLILGGGDGLALRDVLRYQNVETVTLVDLDPAMVEFAKTNPLMASLNENAFADARVYTQASKGITPLHSEPVYYETGKEDKHGKSLVEEVGRVAVYGVDADRFISQSHRRKWDVVIIDFPDPGTVELSKLYSREFFRKLQWHMADHAMVSIQSTSPYYAKEVFLSIARTMESAGLYTVPYQQNIPSFGQWGWHLAWSHEESPDSVVRRIHDIDQFGVNTTFITPEKLVASLAFGKGELDTSIECVNSLMRPCIHALYADHSWQID